MTTEKIYVQMGNDKIELTGADKEAFIADRLIRQDELAALLAEKTARAEAKSALLVKLGITEDEAKLLLS
jgi:hypothetical protein